MRKFIGKILEIEEKIDKLNFPQCHYQVAFLIFINPIAIDGFQYFDFAHFHAHALKIGDFFKKLKALAVEAWFLLYIPKYLC